MIEQEIIIKETPAELGINLAAFPAGMQDEIKNSIIALGKPAGGEEVNKEKGDPVEKVDKEEKIEKKGDSAEEEFIPFVGKEKPATSLDGVEIEKEKFDLISSVFSTSGIKVEKVQDLSIVADEIKTLRTKAEGFESQIRDLEDYKTVFEKLPPDLFAVVKAYLDDEDYRKQMVTVSGSFIDFTKGFKENEAANLIEYYFPNEYSKEDLEEIKDTKEGKILLKTVQSKFESDKTALDKKRTEYVETQQESKKLYIDSVTKSVTALEQSGMLDDSSLNGVKKVLGFGINGILAQFVDKNGNITVQGAERMALALYGKKAIDSLVARGVKKAVSKEREEIINRSSEEGSKKKPGSTTIEVPEGVKKFFETTVPKPSGNIF